MAFDATEFQAWLQTVCDCSGYRGQLRRPRHECGHCITKTLQRAYEAGASVRQKRAYQAGRAAGIEEAVKVTGIFCECATEIRALVQTKGEG